MAKRPRKLTPQNYLRLVETSRVDLERYAQTLGDRVRSDLEHDGIRVNQVAQRVKDSFSLEDKLNSENQYRKDTSSITDLIGVRIIVHYQDEVDIVKEFIKKTFDVNESEGNDRRQILGFKEFGYRSVKLIVREKRRRNANLVILNGGWFEIQIRTVLEHAWAEIEHKVVYKSSIDYPTNFKRKFAALAAVAELLDQEFVNLRGERDALIESYKAQYGAGENPMVAFDSAKLQAFLEVKYPSGYSFRQAEKDGRPFKLSIMARSLRALRSAKINAARTLSRVFKLKSFQKALTEYAANKSIATSQISHPALIKLAVSIKNPKLAEEIVSI